MASAWLAFTSATPVSSTGPATKAEGRLVPAAEQEAQPVTPAIGRQPDRCSPPSGSANEDVVQAIRGVEFRNRGSWVNQTGKIKECLGGEYDRETAPSPRICKGFEGRARATLAGG